MTNTFGYLNAGYIFEHANFSNHALVTSLVNTCLLKVTTMSSLKEVCLVFLNVILIWNNFLSANLIENAEHSI